MCGVCAGVWSVCMECDLCGVWSVTCEGCGV